MDHAGRELPEGGELLGLQDLLLELAHFREVASDGDHALDFAVRAQDGRGVDRHPRDPSADARDFHVEVGRGLAAQGDDERGQKARPLPFREESEEVAAEQVLALHTGYAEEGAIDHPDPRGADR